MPAGFREDRILVRPAAHARPHPAEWQRLHGRLGTGTMRRFPHLRDTELVRLPRGLSVAQALEAFQRSGLVEFAEPDYLLRALIAPNDFQYQNKDQWNLHNTGVYGGLPGADIMAEAGWDLQREAPDITVAIVDTGIRYTHEDLAPNMWVNPGESGLDAAGRDKRTNRIDDDGNGWVDDVHGIDVLAGTGNPLDDWGHGTHVAGIVGAATNNRVGVAGVAWRVKLMAVRFIDLNSNYSTSDAIVALDYARRHGARIINASWGNYAFTSTAFRDAIAGLRDAGIILVAAAGNDNNDNDVRPLYPASYDFDHIVSVAATTRLDTRAGYSNYGARTVDLGAPGSPVFSAWAGTDRDYRYYEGTSMAAPHVAGACALLWARFPNDTAQQIIQRVLSSVDLLPDMAARTTSNGRLNLAAALASGSSTTPPPPPPPPPTPTTGWQSVDVGAVATPGSSSEAGGIVSVSGSGADIWDNADEFHYRYQSWTGDGQIIARLTSLANTHGWAKAGVMFRESLAATSRHALMCVSAANGTALQRRTTTGGASSSTSGFSNGLPRWVRLVRQGGTLTGYESADGTNWTQVDTVNMDLPATIYVGFAVTSHNDGVICPATFDNVSLSGGTTTTPTPTPVVAPSGLAAVAVSTSQINLTWADNSANEAGFQVERSPDQQNYALVASTGSNITQFSDSGRSAATTYYYRVRAVAGTDASGYSNTASATTPPSTTTPPPTTPSWSGADVGAVGVTGSHDIGTQSVTVRGSGDDVWGNADAFRFVYRTLTGDGVIEAQVSSQNAAHAWAKSGVMIRDSLAPNAVNVFAFVTPANGVAVQARSVLGGTTTSRAGTWWVGAPYWVRLVRAGSRISAYESANGSDWTLVTTYDVVLAPTVYVGLAVTSHDNSRLNTAVFASPAVR